jgi:hypothetical protein
MDQEKFEAEAVAQYWFTESEETLAAADHLIESGDYTAQQMAAIRKALVWLQSHRTC